MPVLVSEEGTDRIKADTSYNTGFRYQGTPLPARQDRSIELLVNTGGA